MDYIRAEHKLQSISKLFIPQVIVPQVFFSFFFKTTPQILSTISERKTRKTNMFWSLFIFRNHSKREPCIKEWTPLPIAHNGLMQKRLERKDWKRISAESSLVSRRRSNRSKNCTVNYLYYVHLDTSISLAIPESENSCHICLIRDDVCLCCG